MINTIKNPNVNAGKEDTNNTNKGDIMNVYDLLKGTKEDTKVLEFDIPVKSLEEIIKKNCKALDDYEEDSEPLEEGVEKVYPVYILKVPGKIIFSNTLNHICIDLSMADDVIQKHDGIYEISTDVGVEGGLRDSKINFSMDISNGMNSSKMILDSTNLSFDDSVYYADVEVYNDSYDLSMGDIQMTDKCMSVIDTFADDAIMSAYFLDFNYKKVIVVENDMYYLDKEKGEKCLAKSGNILVLDDLEKMEGYVINQDSFVLHHYLHRIISRD